MLQLSSASVRSFAIFWLPILVGVCSACSNCDGTNARTAAKPWYTESVSENFPVSAVSVGVFIISAVYLLSFWAGPVYNCQASHILIEGHDEETSKQLEKLKQTIGGDANKFKKHAKELSSCPSKNQGGYLGQFKRGVMAPAFDKACFDPNTPLQTAVGPIETSFGWHLIYIHDRKMP
jgi:peptidyl-prolyl cis-trans isomerase C